MFCELPATPEPLDVTPGYRTAPELDPNERPLKNPNGPKGPKGPKKPLKNP
ncbi:hypothetical protein DOT_2588 [Desulfosporosinus sp. OT]|nr:hypothetical protein DOT_2588 [Desulfosporosinus sp. OT]